MLLSNLNLLATAPGGVARLRELILTLAVQGKLVPQDPADEPASDLLARVMQCRAVRTGKSVKSFDDTLPQFPYELPEGWIWAQLGDLVENMGSGWSPACEEGERSDPMRWAVLRTTAVQVNEFRAHEHKVLPSKLSPRPEIEVKDGDILITRAGPMNRVGISCWVDQAPPRLMLSDKIVRFHPVADELLPSFIVLTLNAGYTKDQVEGAKSGMAASQVNISQADLRGLWIPVCSKTEQSRIVARVEELMRLCDALEAKGQLEATQHAQLLSTLLVPQDPTDEPASVLLQKIRAEKDRLIAEGKIKKDKPLPPVTDEEKPFELPAGWEWVRFGEYFFELCTGPFGSVIHKEDYVEGGVPLINPSHMIGGRISHDPSVSVSLEMSIQLRAYRLSPGDVVLARRGEVGRYALVTEAQDGWLCGTGSFFVKLHDSCNREFFGLVLEDPDLRRHLQGESVGSTMVNLNQRILVETSMALPPLPEQSRIVTRITQLRRLCADLRQRLAEREAVQARLAEALVQQVA